ncbi:MAG: alpha/beta hydrolase [Caulobacteraceae bacterium]|nr:alpha/beta hydrolase [Caulobacteraceae bacterium]
MLARPSPTSEKVETREVRAPAPAGAPDVRALLHTPRHSTAPRPAVLHIHGGGYVMGAPEMGAEHHIQYAEDFGTVVLSVDYRLAPATKHPGPLEDCYAALAWLYAQADELGVDRRRIIVSGESAGGGLAAALALLARDRKEYALAFQHLIYPMIDDRTVTRPAPSPYSGEFIWTRAANLHGWSSLLDCEPGADGVSCYAAAARAEDLSGLPPTYIACGALDLFIEENLEYARRLILAGVPTELHVYPGAPHGFPMVADAKVARQAERDSLEALGRALARPSD